MAFDIGRHILISTCHSRPAAFAWGAISLNIWRSTGIADSAREQDTKFATPRRIMALALAVNGGNTTDDGYRPGAGSSRNSQIRTLTISSSDSPANSRDDGIAAAVSWSEMESKVTHLKDRIPRDLPSATAVHSMTQPKEHLKPKADYCSREQTWPLPS